MAGIILEKISKAFPLEGGQRRPALESVDLAVLEGEFVTVLGPSGSGKTTLLNLVSGLATPDSGEIHFAGVRRPVPQNGRSRGPVIGMVFQDARLLPWMTIRENVRFVLDPEPGTPGREVDAEISRWLCRVGLDGTDLLYPHQLSIGMQQRVAVIRALAVEPELLLMDEPFSALDEMTARRLRDELLGLWEETRCTVIFVTHNPFEAAYLSDRIVVMSGKPGSIGGELCTSELYPRPRTPDDPRIWKIGQDAIAGFQ